MRFTWPFVLATMRSTAVPTSRFMLPKSSSTSAAFGGLVMNLRGAMVNRVGGGAFEYVGVFKPGGGRSEPTGV